MSLSIYPTVSVSAVQRPVNGNKSRPRLPIPDEDPYSIAGNANHRLALHPMDGSDSSGYSGGSGSGSGGPSTIGEDTTGK